MSEDKYVALQEQQKSLLSVPHTARGDGSQTLDPPLPPTVPLPGNSVVRPDIGDATAKVGCTTQERNTIYVLIVGLALSVGCAAFFFDNIEDDFWLFLFPTLNLFCLLCYWQEITTCLRAMTRC